MSNPNSNTSTNVSNTNFIKRLNYEKVRISTIGGVLECQPSTDGWQVAFHFQKDPRTAYGKSVEEAGLSLVKDLQYVIRAIEEDLKAFAERNK